MAAERDLQKGTKLFKEQLITVEDLEAFKVDLLKTIEQLLRPVRRPENSKEWLKSSEVRKMLGVSPGTLQNLRVSGKLPFTKIGRLFFYRHQDITGLLEGSRRK